MTEKHVAILFDQDLFDIINKYCADNRINRSSFIRGLIVKKLQEEKYINKDEVNKT
jgi:metal-responsive CopG/Arc/MetJ family transcriptional regulator